MLTTAMQTVTDPAEFKKFLTFSSKGARAVYHRGDLAADRLESESLDEIASMANAAAKTGRVHLCQKREGITFAYVATIAR